MELFAKIVNSFQLLTILTKGFILHVGVGSKYACANCYLKTFIEVVKFNLNRFVSNS